MPDSGNNTQYDLPNMHIDISGGAMSDEECYRAI